MAGVEDITDIKRVLEEKFQQIYGGKVTAIEIKSAIKYTTFGYWEVVAKIKINGLESEYSIKIDRNTGNIISLNEK